MALMKCPKCKSAIDVADLNMAQGVALCRVCGDLKMLSEVMSVPVMDPADASQPPAGCRVEDWGSGVRYEASCRSIPLAVFFGVFATFWNGVIWTMVVAVLSGNAILRSGSSGPSSPAPSGPPASGQDIVFQCLFMIPFVLAGLGVAFGFILAAFGKVRVTIDGNNGRVRTGVGLLSWTRSFEVSNVKAVTFGQTAYVVNNRHKPLIVIEAAKTLQFGSGLSDRRRKWLAAMLAERLVHA